MLAPDVDVAILGGGCAGLSLAVRLAQSHLSVRVIEPRAEYIDDRAWSFWRTQSDPFEDCVRKEWSSWTVKGPRGKTLRSSSHMRYQTVTSGAFYNRALELIGQGKATSISMGVSAGDVVRSGQGWRIDTGAGTLTAKTVVDTRPPRRIPTYGQFFLGREIRTERPVFDPDTVQLMNFRSARSTGVDFVYILPFAVDQALVEVTSFAPQNPGHAVFTEWLDDEVEALNPGKTETIRTEAGALPMEVGFADPAPNGIIRIGLGGGAARPSTGYASLMALTLVSLLKWLGSRGVSQKFVRIGIWFSIAAAIADYLENTGIYLMILSWPEISANTVSAASVASIVKSGLTTAAVLTVLLGAVFWAFKRIRSYARSMPAEGPIGKHILQRPE